MYLTEEQAADIIGVRAATLRTWRHFNLNLSYYKLKKGVLYNKPEVKVFAKQWNKTTA